MDEKTRFDIIQYVVQELSAPGKVKVQKVMYFIQEALKVPLDYEYVMHYYGPYSFQLEESLSEMRGRELLQISMYAHAQGYGYEIKLGEKANPSPEPAPEWKKPIDHAVDILGKLDPQTLELWATIHFVRDILQEKSRPSDRETILGEVKKLKPKFSRDEISKAYGRMFEERLITR